MEQVSAISASSPLCAVCRLYCSPVHSFPCSTISAEGRNGRGGRLCTTPNVLLHDFFTSSDYRFTWAQFLKLAGPLPSHPQRRARYNGTTFQLRRDGYYTVGQLCEAAGVPDSTFRDWEGTLIPKLPTVNGIRAVRKQEFDALVAKCKQLGRRRRRGWNFRRTVSASEEMSVSSGRN